MSTPDDNPYAAPQAPIVHEIPLASSVVIPMAREVFARRAFKEIPTVELARYVNASRIITIIDWIYLTLTALLNSVAIFSLIAFYLQNAERLPYQKFNYQRLSFSLSGFLISLAMIVAIFIVKERYIFSRVLGIVMDCIWLMLFIALFIYGLSYEYTELMFFVWPFVAITIFGMMTRFQFKVLFGPKKHDHQELIKEHSYRILNRVA
jgi:hypothetical protein